jgi:hypothetical protein
LTCPLPSGEWVWLVDHTVQIGACKLSMTGQRARNC